MLNNLNLSLQFDQRKKFLLCGELVKFNLKITSPDFSDDNVPEFMERIGATVEGIEIIQDYLLTTSTSSNSADQSQSLYSLKGKKMKSVESLSNLLKTCVTRDQNQHNSKDSQTSQCSMSSVTARRFNSLRKTQAKSVWNLEEGAILVPLEAFIDSESLGSTKGVAKIKVSLNELVPIDSISDLLSNNNHHRHVEPTSPLIQIQNTTQKLLKIGQAELSLPVLRPLEVSLRTHSLSPTHSILQLNMEYNNNNNNNDSNMKLEIENVEIFISNTWNSNNSAFKIVPISNNQVPFIFETCPQQHSLLFNWTLLNEIDEDEDFRVRVEVSGQVEQVNCSVFSLSFESSISIFNLFPSYEREDVQITLLKVLNDKICPLVPFQIELILHNYSKEMKSFNLNFICDSNLKSTRQSKQLKSSNENANAIQEWFRMEESKKSPNILLMNPLDLPLKLERFPSGGSKAVRLKFVAIKSGFFNLKDELRVICDDNTLNFDSIIIKVE